jgi:hypothetical protein
MPSEAMVVSWCCSKVQALWLMVDDCAGVGTVGPPCLHLMQTGEQ